MTVRKGSKLLNKILKSKWKKTSPKTKHFSTSELSWSYTSSLWLHGPVWKTWILVAYSVIWIKVTEQFLTSHFNFKNITLNMYNHTFFYKPHFLLEYSTSYDQYQAKWSAYLHICLQIRLCWLLNLLSTSLSPNLQSNLNSFVILLFPWVH